MADFWGGFGQGFGRSFESSYDRAARRRELREQREYQKELADDKERRERARASEALVADMELQRLKPWAKGVLPKGETVRGGLEEVSFKDPSPLFGEQGLRREITQKTPEAALRERSLEQKAAYSKHLGVAKSAYEKRIASDVGTIKAVAANLHVATPERKAEVERQLKEMKDRYSDDPNATRELADAANVGTAETATAIGKIFVVKEREKAEKAAAKTRAFNAQKPLYLNALLRLDGTYKSTHEGIARTYFEADRLTELVSEADKAVSLRGIMAAAEDQGIGVPAGFENSPELMSKWATANLEHLQSPTELEKKFKFIAEYESVVVEAKERFDEAEALKGEDDIVREQDALNKAIAGMKLATAAAWSKGWEMEVSDDGEVFARKINEDGSDAGYSMGYMPVLGGGLRAYPKYDTGMTPEQFKKAEDAFAIDVRRFMKAAIGKIDKSGGIGDRSPEDNPATQRLMDSVKEGVDKEYMQKAVTYLLEKKKTKGLDEFEKQQLEDLLFKLNPPQIPPLPTGQ